MSAEEGSNLDSPPRTPRHVDIGLNGDHDGNQSDSHAPNASPDATPTGGIGEESGRGLTEEEMREREREQIEQMGRKKTISSIDWKEFTLYLRIEEHCVEISRIDCFNSTRTATGRYGQGPWNKLSKEEEERHLEAERVQRIREYTDSSSSYRADVETETNPHEVIYRIYTGSKPLMCSWYDSSVSRNVGYYSESSGDPLCGGFVLYDDNKKLTYFTPHDWDARDGCPTKVRADDDSFSTESVY